MLAAAVPLVVVPLFSGDQWSNAEAVARSGAGIALDGERLTRRVVDLPGPATLDGLADAVRCVLEDPAYRDASQRVAGAMRALPPAESAVAELEGLTRESARRATTPRARLR
jgi:UDP:flavonoid glycosyltransferase YjiC (YdhE family)